MVCLKYSMEIEDMSNEYTFEDFEKNGNRLNMYIGVKLLLESLNIKVDVNEYSINAFSLSKGPMIIYGCEDKGLLISVSSKDVINLVVKLPDGTVNIKAFSLKETEADIRLIPDFKAVVDPLILNDIECVLYVVNDLTNVVEGMKSEPGYGEIDTPRIKYC